MNETSTTSGADASFDPFLEAKNYAFQRDPNLPPFSFVSVFPYHWTKKPTGVQYGWMNKHIADHRFFITINELYRAVTEGGRTWTAGWFDVEATGGRKTGDAWRIQQLFALDFDDGGLTWQDALDVCKHRGIHPCMMYTTFSAKEDERFRMVFNLPAPVDDERIRNVINRLLLETFPEADQKTKDAARLITGGKKGLYLDDGAVLDPQKLVDAFHMTLIEHSPSNYGRKIQKVAQSLGLALTERGVLDISFDESEVPENVGDILDDQQSEENHADCAQLNETEVTKKRQHYRYLKSCQIFVTCFFHFIDKSSSIVSKKTDEEKSPTMSIGRASHDDNRVGLVEHPNWQHLSTKCPVFRAFSNHERRFTKDELFAIATNLDHLKGGIKRFQEIIADAPFEYDQQSLGAMLTYIRKRGYAPATYASYFPDVVSDYPSMYHAALTDYGKIVVVGDRETMSLAEAERVFADRFEEVMAATEPGIYVIKAPTAMGKTERYIKLQAGITIALPRHDLIEEVAARMKSTGSEPLVLPSFPAGQIPPHVEAEVIDLWSIGATTQAMRQLRYHNVHERHPAIGEYLDGRDAAKSVSRQDIFLTTHISALSVEVPHNTILFDEDFLGTALQINQLDLDDIRVLHDTVTKEREKPLDKSFSDLLADVVRWCSDMLSVDLSDNVVEVNCVEIARLQDRYLLEELASTLKIKSKVLAGLSASHVLRVGFELHTVSFMEPPRNKKVVILSATADEWLYRELFGDRLKGFYDLGLVESKGRVVQYYSRSFSRSCMAGMNNLESFLAARHSNGEHRITFKKHQDVLGADLHFGATTGLDVFAGHDTVVIGTPHTHTIQHRLVAAVCGHCTGPDDLMMVNQQVERNGLRFWFYTYRDEVLRNIALHLIEAELIQAVGRSRHLRHDVTVTVYSNYPVSGAEYHRLSAEEIEAMMQRTDTQDRDASDDSIDSEQVVHSMILQLIPVGRMIKRHVVSEPLY